MTAAPTVVVAAALAQRSRRAGHVWAILQYLLGFRRLGYDVVFIDRLEAAMLPEGESDRPVEHSSDAARLARMMERFGLGNHFALLSDGGRSCAGLGRRQLVDLAARSVAVFNVMGYLDDAEILGAFPLRVFLDIDPGFGQMWQQLGLHDGYGGHDRFVTVAANIGKPDCAIPTCDRAWSTTIPPVVLSEWPPQDSIADRITSVATWRGPYAPVAFGGVTYGLRVHEFRKFVSLPGSAPGEFEIVLDIDAGDADDRAALIDNGWVIRDPDAAADVDAYRDYIAASRAELMVAKNMYVAANSGWFSDRSVCYLASGRPVIAQDTGWTATLAPRDGLAAFRTVEEAATALEDMNARYEAHRRGARDLACEMFDSDRVLGRLLNTIGVA